MGMSAAIEWKGGVAAFSPLFLIRSGRRAQGLPRVPDERAAASVLAMTLRKGPALPSAWFSPTWLRNRRSPLGGLATANRHYTVVPNWAASRASSAPFSEGRTQARPG